MLRRLTRQPNKTKTSPSTSKSCTTLSDRKEGGVREGGNVLFPKTLERLSSDYLQGTQVFRINKFVVG